MPQRPADPGVHMREAPSGPPSIASASTSVAAFVGWLPEGPVDEPVQLFSYADFEREFGGLHRDSELSYAVQQFFQLGGTEAWVIRTVADDALASSVELSHVNTGSTTISAVSKGKWGDSLQIAAYPNSDNSPEDFDLVVRKIREEQRPDGSTRIVTLEQETYKNVKSADEDPLEDSDLILSPGAFSDVLNHTWRLTDNAFSTPPLLNSPVSFKVDSGDPYLAVHHHPTDASKFRLFLHDGDPAGVTPIKYANLNSTLTATTGSSSDDYWISTADFSEVDGLSLIEFQLRLPDDIKQEETKFTDGLVTADGSDIDDIGSIRVGDVVFELEKDGADDLALVTQDDGSSKQVKLKTWSNGDDGQWDLETFFNELKNDDFSSFGLTVSNKKLAGRPKATESWPPTAEEPKNADFLSLTGGKDGAIPGDKAWNGDSSTGSKGAAALKGNATAPNKPGGFEKLKDIKPNRFNILALPDAAHFKEVAMVDTYKNAQSFCEEQDAFLIVDPPDLITSRPDKFDQFDKLKNWIAGDGASLRHENAALYFPRIEVPDPKRDFKPKLMGPSGTLAGVYARTDTNRGVWKAPAGMQATLGAGKPAFKLNSGQRGTLNDLGVNVLRSLAGTGPVSWGARTLVGYTGSANPDSKYVPVRRMTLFLKQSLEDGMTWAVFEPNDETLWGQIRLTVGSFMDRLFQQGAFQGETADEAYFVRCDSSTTTQDDINRGIVNVVVGFAPLKPAEFVVITIKQKAGQGGS